MTLPLDAAGLAEALSAQAKAYETYRTQQRNLSAEAWKDCHGDTTPPELALAAAIRAYLASAEPAGWRLVPPDITPEMAHALESNFAECTEPSAVHQENWSGAYKQMLLLAPLPAAPTPQGDERK